MAQCLIVADDLTGANATGVLIKKNGYDTNTIISTEGFEQAAIDSSECIIFPTDSRAIARDIAYTRVHNATRLFQSEQIHIYGKRIDSTLRGNLGAELDAMLDALGEEYIAISAPCFPESGRIVCGGLMLVNGVPLSKTAVANDPKTPVHTSVVADVFRQQSRHPVASVYLNEYTQGAEHVRDRILEKVREGNRILVFDCVSREDLELIAEAAFLAGIPFVSVDPGVFTSIVIRRRLRPRIEVMPKNKVLAVIGSVNPVTAAQVEHYRQRQDAYFVTANTRRFLSEEESGQEISRIVEEVLAHVDEKDVFVVVGDGLDPAFRLDFPKLCESLGMDVDALSRRINFAFAEIAMRIHQGDSRFQGFYTSGGDITVAVYKKMRALGISLRDEVLPLAAYGIIVGGAADGLQVVTKGGMVGDADALELCIQYLINRI